MDFKDSLLQGFVHGLESRSAYQIEVHCIISVGLGVPDYIKKDHIGEPIMFVIRSDQKSNPTYDISSRELIWDTTFNRVPCTITIPVDSIIGIIDSYDGAGFQMLNAKGKDNSKEPAHEEPAHEEPAHEEPRPQKQSKSKNFIEDDVICKKGNFTLLRGGKYKPQQ